MSPDTIAAISTPPGRGGIGIVRLSGPLARTIAEPLLRLRTPLAPNRVRFAELLDISADPASPTVLDQAVVTLFAAPNSYTGDDVVEIALHGSPVLLDHALRQCLALGARLAEPGEFTLRAFLAGRIDLTQAEAVDDLIDSSTLEQARLAARQMGGSLARAAAHPKELLISLIASLEAGIDFAEDDIDTLPPDAITASIDTVLPLLRALAASFAHGRILREGLRLAIVGRPNAGKSSLFNRLLQRDRAIVTATPGTTRDTVSERLSLNGIPLELTDTAGLREAHDEAEQLGIARSHQAMADADLTLLVVDATAGLTPDDQSILAQHHADLNIEDRPLEGVDRVDGEGRQEIEGRQESEDLVGDEGRHSGAQLQNLRISSPPQNPSAGTDGCPVLAPLGREVPPPTPVALPSRPILLAWNKSDLPTTHTPPPGAIPTSALTGQGIDTLRDAIARIVGAGPTSEAGILTSLRQHTAVQSTLDALEKARAAALAATPHEMLLLDLYEALRHLDTLTGATTTDDILHLVFSRFCIGK